MVTSRPGLLLVTMSGSVVLQQPGSVLLSIAPDTMEGQVDAGILAATQQDNTTVETMPI